MNLPKRKTEDDSTTSETDRYKRTIPQVIRELAEANNAPSPNRWIPSAQGVGARLNGHRVAGRKPLFGDRTENDT